MKTCLPAAAVLLTLGYFSWQALPTSRVEGDFDYEAFGRLPIVQGGRVKPIDTLARTDLMLVSDRQEYKEYRKDSDGRLSAWDSQDYTRRSAVKWLLDSLAFSELMDVFQGGTPTPPVSFEHRVVRIENEEILDFLKLAPRPGFLRYSVNEIQDRMNRVYEEAEEAEKAKPKKRTLKQAKVLELAHRLEIYFDLLKGNTPHVLPPRTTKEEWKTLAEGISESLSANGGRGESKAHPALNGWLAMLNAYRRGDVARFNKVVAQYGNYCARLLPGYVQTGNCEVLLNRAAPFYHCTILYGLLFLLGCLSWIAWPQVLNRVTFSVMMVVALVHTLALVTRMYIQGRPPVTNLYSSAIYIGWTGVLTCLFIEYLHRNGLALVAGSVLGFLSLIVAHFLSTSGDTMEMMQAVLDTNFWLATHVTTVTYGYTATFLAGFMGIAYIVIGLFGVLLVRLGQPVETDHRPATRMLAWIALIVIFGGFFVLSWAFQWLAVFCRSILRAQRVDADTSPSLRNVLRSSQSSSLLRPETGTAIAKATYGVICFAMFLSFVGTVLGGIWADQSWGRFWGWDPKENGALLIVLWNALILHARWAGLVKQRGVAVLAVAGNIVTAWSWFGTNLLGVGLHSYGFMSGAMYWLLIFAASQLFICFLGALPLPYWKPLIHRRPSPSDEVPNETSASAIA
jgi:ABC-type transport system involved in cytochrome c biogenesis permease subunit